MRLTRTPASSGSCTMPGCSTSSPPPIDIFGFVAHHVRALLNAARSVRTVTMTAT